MFARRGPKKNKRKKTKFESKKKERAMIALWNKSARFSKYFYFVGESVEIYQNSLKLITFSDNYLLLNVRLRCILHNITYIRCICKFDWFNFKRVPA